jgi:hypothetical protein
MKRPNKLARIDIDAGDITITKKRDCWATLTLQTSACTPTTGLEIELAILNKQI